MIEASAAMRMQTAMDAEKVFVTSAVFIPVFNQSSADHYKRCTWCTFSYIIYILLFLNEL